MSVVCSVDYEIAKGYEGKNLIAKVENKKQQVFLKLTCSENDLESSLALARNSKNIVMVEYQGLPDSQVFQDIKTGGVYVGVVKDAGADIDFPDVEEMLDGIPEGVTLIIRLPSGYCSLGKLWELTKSYPHVRFCGGLLFDVDGVNVGMVGLDVLDKFKGKYDESSYILDGSDDCVPDLDIFDLQVETTAAPITVKKGGNSNTVKKKPVVSFASLMADCEVVGP